MLAIVQSDDRGLFVLREGWKFRSRKKTRYRIGQVLETRWTSGIRGWFHMGLDLVDKRGIEDWNRD